MKLFLLDLRCAYFRVPAAAACAVAMLWVGGAQRPESRAAIGTPGVEPVPAPARWDTYPPDTRDRAEVRGRLLAQVRSGMTRTQVEAILGPSDNPRDAVDRGRDDKLWLCKPYWCVLPHLRHEKGGGSYNVSVDYDASGPEPILVDIVRDMRDHFLPAFAP